MHEYQNLIRHILAEGVRKDDRTGTGTLSVFGYQARYDLRKGFPLVTTKKVHFKSVLAELLWFLSGSTNNNDLEKLGATIWREWSREDGELGPIYSKQWRSWTRFTDDIYDPIDQIEWVIDEIKRNPDSRRLVVSAWNVADLSEMALAPCHCLFQFYVANGRLSCQLYQRSADVFLGVPFNIASYALLTHMIAQVTGLQPGEFIHSFGDAHLYLNHLTQAKQLLNREPRPLPKLILNPAITCIDDFTVDDVYLQDYQPHPKIEAPVAV